jgi:hypothetical protein
MDLTTKTETIQFGETKVLGIFKKAIKFKVVADMPDSLLPIYGEISKIRDADNSPEEQKKAFDLMRKAIIQILGEHNRKGKVKSFVTKLGMQGLNKVWTFLNEYINGEEGEKKNE